MRRTVVLNFLNISYAKSLATHETENKPHGFKKVNERCQYVFNVREQEDGECLRMQFLYAVLVSSATHLK